MTPAQERTALLEEIIAQLMARAVELAGKVDADPETRLLIARRALDRAAMILGMGEPS